MSSPSQQNQLSGGSEVKATEKVAVENVKDEHASSEEAIAKDALIERTEVDLTDISEQIIALQLELHRLRKEQHFRLRQTPHEPVPPPKDLSNKDNLNRLALDLKLQKQVLMLLEAMPHMVWIADAEGKAIHANDRYYELTGYSRHQDDGWSWVNFIHHDDFAKVMEAGNQAAIENRSFSIEFRHKDASGLFQWQLLHCIPFFDPDTQSTKWFGTTTNIHEQKVLQEKLAKNEAQLRTLADAIPHIVFAANPDGSIYFWNHRWFEYTGLTIEQSASEAWTLLIHPQDRNRYLEEWREALKSGDTFEFEFRLSRAVGVGNAPAPQGYLWHLARAVAMRDSEDRIIRWFETWTEIEGQKRAEK